MDLAKTVGAPTRGLSERANLTLTMLTPCQNFNKPLLLTIQISLVLHQFANDQHKHNKTFPTQHDKYHILLTIHNTKPSIVSSYRQLHPTSLAAATAIDAYRHSHCRSPHNSDCRDSHRIVTPSSLSTTIAIAIVVLWPWK